MWPEDFPTWWPAVQPPVFERIRDRLLRYRLLTTDGAAAGPGRNLAQAATRAVFDRADGLQVHPGYFPDLAAFRRWAIECGYLEALRLLPEQEQVRPWFDQLPADERRILQWAYVEPLTDGQLARALGQQTPQQTRALVLAAYRSFCTLLQANGYGLDDDAATFPLLPVLFGLG
jgi:hypothetical protein